MDPKQRKKWIRLGFLAIRSAGVYLTFALVSVSLYYLMFLCNYDRRAQANYLSLTVLHAVCLAYGLLLYYSLVRSDALYSRPLCERFLAGWNRDAQPGVLRRLRFTLTSPEYRVDLLVHTLFLLVFPSGFGFAALRDLLATHGNHGLVFLILAPSLALLGLLARLSALTGWTVAWNKKAGRPHPEEHPTRRLLLRILLTCPLFLMTAAFSPLGLRMLYALSTVLLLIDPRVLVGILIGIPLLWYLVRFLFAVGKRRRFFGRLRALCRANGWEISKIRNGYRSVLLPVAGANFTVRRGEERYDCRFISSLARYSPMLFHEDGTVTHTYVLRLFSLNLFHFNVTYDYRFEGEGKKILVLIPTPEEIFVSGYGVTQVAYPGSRTADYTIYGATDLLNALERGTVGR